VETLLADLRSGLRLLRRSPAFGAVAIGTLALGIGANTAIFSTVYSALLRALPYRDPDRIVMVWEDASYISFPRNTPAPANYVDWKTMNRVFTDMAATRGQVVNLTGDGPPEQIIGRGVTPSFFAVLGVQPALGRAFTEDEDRAQAQVVILSYGLWQRRFGGDPAIVGRGILMNGAPRTVIGVMPRGFVFRNRDLDFWAPIAMTPEVAARRGSHFLNVVARLAPGVTVAQAQADMQRVAAQLATQYPTTNAHVGAAVVPIRTDLLGDVQLELLVLMAAAACVLLIACANLASLLVVRAASRRGEMTVRVSLGATERRLAQQMVVEGVVLAVFGGVLGLFVAPLAMRVIARLVPTSMPPMDATVLSLPILMFTLALSVATGVVFSLMPAFTAARASLAAGLRHAGRSGVGHRRFGSAMVVVQVAVAIALLVSAGLLLRTLSNLRHLDLGFRTDHVLTVRTTLPSDKYKDAARRRASTTGCSTRCALPGVESAAYGSTLPFMSPGNTRWFAIDGRTQAPDDPADTLYRVGTNDYLQTLDVQVVSGRLRDARDGKDAPASLVVNETLARRHWPDESALGHRVTFARLGDEGAWYTIVGVVRDVRERGFEREMKPGVYLPFAQALDTWALPEMLVVRTRTDPLALTAAIRRIVASADPEQPVANVRTLDEIVDLDVADRTEQLTLLASFAGLALLLASLGLYGLLAYAVTERRREIGLRMAIGARARNVVLSVVARGLVLTIAGVAIGLVLSAGAATAIGSLLYGVQAIDPLTLAGAAVLFGRSRWWRPPCRLLRAARVDPTTALREE
jgi:predicted permease